jgi:hypothetical protein
MADEQFQRPYRASEPPVRGGAKTSANNDPLAELARLIGQTDPFGEFGRDSARRAPASERVDWSAQPSAPPSAPPYAPQTGNDPRAGMPSSPRPGSDGYYNPRYAPAEQVDAPQGHYGSQGYGRQTYAETAPISDDLYQTEHELTAQGDYQQDSQESYDQDSGLQEEEYYDDVPSSRRRFGVMAIAAAFALAIVGTAGAFGYRALFGSSGTPQPPPIIKADTGPSKIVPVAAGKDSNKLITDRVNERGQSEKLVSREEQPIDKPTTVVLSQPAQQSALGTGVVGTEPKKVRTIAIHPDQVVAEAASSPATSSLGVAPAARAAPAPVTPPRPAPPPPPRVVDNSTADAEQDSSPPPAARAAAAPVRQAAPASNGPLSLNPDSPARAPAARTAAVAPPAQQAAPPPAASANASASAAGPGSYVQVSSQRSEAEAQSAYRSLQGKYPNQLGGRQAQILRVDLGAKGTYYRALVGPFASAGEAAELCSSLKAAGGQCLIQRN